MNEKEIISERLRNFLYLGNEKFYGLKYYVSYGTDVNKNQIAKSLTDFAVKAVTDSNFQFDPLEKVIEYCN